MSRPRLSRDEQEIIERFLTRVGEAADQARHNGDDDLADNLYFGASFVRELIAKSHDRGSSRKVNKLFVPEMPSGRG